LNKYKRNISPGATATRPKYALEVDGNIVYFKFKLLKIPAAKVILATYKGEIGVGSYDIGAYSEPEESGLYSVKDYTGITGFIEMCLFDYLIMNEDRHAGNWGMSENESAVPFDHNLTFGGDAAIRDADHFMNTVSSAFCVETEYDYQHDKILKYIADSFPAETEQFMSKISLLDELEIDILENNFPQQYSVVRNLLNKRLKYMKAKISSFQKEGGDCDE
jgi:hypothetical protein